MKSKSIQVIIGSCVIFIGALLLLHNFQIFYLDEKFFWGIAFIFLGGIFIRIYKGGAPGKGSLIWGTGFLLLGLSIILDTLLYIPRELIGTFFCWIIGMFFIAIYVHNNNHWWAILPGGMFIIVGSIVAINAFHLLEGKILWFVFLSGISLIFWFLYLIKDEINKLSWAIYPAFLLMIFSFFILSFIWKNQAGEMLFPLSIILGGAYLIIKNIRRKKPMS